jgi:hypothetical protein
MAPPEKSSASSEFDYAPGWKPNPGDVVKGTVTEINEYAGGGYGSYPIVTLAQENGDGEVALHCFHTALRNQLAELGVQVGDNVGVFYKGKVQKASGDGTYESYRVKRLNRGAPRAFDWAREREAAVADPTPTELHAPLETREEDNDIPF